MEGQLKFAYNSPAVQKYVEIMQAVITRMANNSRACKFWCVTLASAVMVLIARTDKPEYALIALVPAVMFLILDTYYLVLERAFRESYMAFVDKLQGGGSEARDLYRVMRSDIGLELVWKCVRSFSILTFYPVLVCMILLMCWIVN